MRQKSYNIHVCQMRGSTVENPEIVNYPILGLKNTCIVRIRAKKTTFVKQILKSSGADSKEKSPKFNPEY